MNEGGGLALCQIQAANTPKQSAKLASAKWKPIQLTNNGLGGLPIWQCIGQLPFRAFLGRIQNCKNKIDACVVSPLILPCQSLLGKWDQADC
jgi:hypothetical protein